MSFNVMKLRDRKCHGVATVLVLDPKVVILTKVKKLQGDLGGSVLILYNHASFYYHFSAYTVRLVISIVVRFGLDHSFGLDQTTIVVTQSPWAPLGT